MRHSYLGPVDEMHQEGVSSLVEDLDSLQDVYLFRVPEFCHCCFMSSC